jgi:hypothetical protein
MSATKWKTLPFETAVHSRGSGGLGLPTKQWLPSGQFPVIGQGAEEIEGWTDRKDLLLTPTPAVVLYGGHTRRAKHVSQPFVPGPNVKILQPDPAVDSKFLYYFLTQLPVESKGYADHFPLVRKCQVPVPSLPEQQRIVGVLDEAFEGLTTAKANAEKNLQNARALFESHLQSVFTQRGPGWVEKKLEDIGKTQTGSTPKTSDQSNYGDFISFVKPGDFNTDGTLDYDKDGLSESGAASARIVPAGSVLMVCIGATIGKCGYCDQDVTTNQQVNALTPSDGSSNRFIYYQMLTETFQRKVIHASGQATLPIINKSKWSALSVWLPPKVGEQKNIAAKFDALVEETERLAQIYEQKLASLEALKKSLLHQAFSGEL